MSLETLNALRTSAGMKPLKAWKESKAKLAEAITKLEARVGTFTPDRVIVESVPVQSVLGEGLSVGTQRVKGRVSDTNPMGRTAEETEALEAMIADEEEHQRRAAHAKADLQFDSIRDQVEATAIPVNVKPSKAERGVKDGVPEVDPRPRGKVVKTFRTMPGKTEITVTGKEETAKKLKADINAATGTVSLVAIAKELGMDPKVARAKMRRVKTPTEYTADGPHTYHAQHKQWVIDQLRTDFRKK